MIFRSTRLGLFSIDLIDSIDQLRGLLCNSWAYCFFLSADNESCSIC